jgi:hypothetical protein
MDDGHKNVVVDGTTMGLAFRVVQQQQHLLSSAEIPRRLDAARQDNPMISYDDDECNNDHDDDDE